MNPFHFGSSAHPLFGVYHPGAPGVHARGVVLCYPLGGEYLRAHRAFRQLTRLLVREGVHVFRFDYRGTGDSWGDSLDLSLSGALEDIGQAVDEFRESAALDRVSLAGLRLGGNLALDAAARRDDIESVVLWDPVVDGTSYLAELDWVEVGIDLPPGERLPTAFPSGSRGSGGVVWSRELLEGVASRSLSDRVFPPGLRTSIFTSWIDEMLPGVAERARAAGREVEHRSVPSAGDWAKGDRFGSALIPQAIIQEVARTLSTRRVPT